jgi:outer membrane protein OmpA-like peptidoglycan-associated protein
LPHAVANNLWQGWLWDSTALSAAQHLQSVDPCLPFPDPLLSLLPDTPHNPGLRRASSIALWLFVGAGAIALLSSARQNTLLVRQVSDDLHRYTAITPPQTVDQPTFALREQALSVLREDAERLNHYYRQGEPLALGLGLYPGERLRLPVLGMIANHRQPTPATIAANVPTMVRLDSLSLFSPGSAELRPDSTKVLINALVGVKAQPGWLIVIAGHTDATGNPDLNLRLSRARASAVHDWMRSMGDMADSCFAVQGFGASQPIASNENASGRAANRRVDIRLVPQVGACEPLTAAPGRQPQVASGDVHY